MKKILTMIFCAFIGMTVMAQKNVYKFSVKDGDGKTIKMKQFKGKILLIVNTATKCGFTPQYAELQKLYDAYKDKGLVVLDFPCNQFGEQAPGTYREINAFCTTTYGTTFPQFNKIDVNGKNESPLYTYLKAQKGFKGFDLTNKIGQYLDAKFREKDPAYDRNPSIKWNFTKFLVDQSGTVVERFEPTDDINKVETSIQQLLDMKKKVGH